MKEYFYNTITHPTDLFREMTKLLESIDDKTTVVRELIDLGNDNWAIYGSIEYIENFKLTIKTNYTKNWMRLLFIKFDDNDIILDAEVSMANTYESTPQIGFESYKTTTWIQKKGFVRSLMVFLNEDFLKKDLWNLDLNTIRNKELKPRVCEIQPKIPEVVQNLLANQLTCFTDLNLFKKREIVLKLICDSLWVIFPNQNLQITEKLRTEILGIRQAKRQLMNDFSSEPLTLDELAKIAGVNRVKFQKLFKEQYGDNFYTYYQKGRFNHAKYLIEEKNYNLCEAGSAIGFRNLTHFSRQFERFMGIKPIQCKSKVNIFAFT